MKKAILLVSFGTSHADTRKKTLDVIQEETAVRFPDFAVYHAWTSGMIIRKLAVRDGIVIPTVKDAMEQMIRDGVEELVVQPTHMINGIENDRMMDTVKEYQGSFRKVVFGKPALTTTKDNERMIRAVMSEFDLADDQALVWMGHGTQHYANHVYAALDYMLKDLGYKHVVMGTVEAYPSMEELIRHVQEMQVRRVILAPFMMVAGDHAKNDMSGEDDDSWKSQFEKAGFRVECLLKGLGEYPKVREIITAHTQEAVEELG